MWHDASQQVTALDRKTLARLRQVSSSLDPSEKGAENMAEQYLGVVASGAQLNGVHLVIDNDSAVLNNQFTWKLQSGDQALAYAAIYDRVKDYVQNNSVQKVVIKASAVGKNNVRRGTLSN